MGVTRALLPAFRLTLGDQAELLPKTTSGRSCGIGSFGGAIGYHVKLVNGTEKPVSRPDGKRVLLLPLAFTFGLAGLALLPPVRQNPRVLITFLGAAAALCAWNAILFVWARRSGRMLTLEVVLRKQHYLQACAQGSVLLYWGWYWPQVYASAYLHRGPTGLRVRIRHAARAGRGATPTLSASLRFPSSSASISSSGSRPDWFYFQFAMVALGLAAKELIRWNREGRSVHIFNPSSFPLAVFSLILIATDASDLTWGKNIASTQFYPPHMYLMLFLIGLPGQFFFGVTSMTMSAVVSTVPVRPHLFRRNRCLFLLRFVYSDCRLPGDASAV